METMTSSSTKENPVAAPGRAPDWAAIVAAHARIAPRIHRTPVLTSASLDAIAGAHLFFKCDNFQKTGSFKVRGAFNKALSLGPEERGRGIVAVSGGNHAQATAYVARALGLRALILPAVGRSQNQTLHLKSQRHQLERIS